MVGKKTENKAVGRTKGGLNTKIHAIWMGWGILLPFCSLPVMTMILLTPLNLWA